MSIRIHRYNLTGLVGKYTRHMPRRNIVVISLGFDVKEIWNDWLRTRRLNVIET